MLRAVIASLLALTLAAVALAAPSRPRPALATSCGAVSDFAPKWSPNGLTVLFTRERAFGAVSSVYRIGADGRNERRLTALGDYAYGPIWSPDGKRIAYTMFDLQALAHVVLAHADGSGPQVVASFQGMRNPPTTFLTWSISGELAYVDFDGNLRTPQRVIARGATQPAWSPDGLRIAYVGTQGITVADASGANGRVIADGGSPVWSPDGARLAYTAGPGVGVHVIGSDERGDVLVDAKGTDPRWAPDGRSIVDVLYVGSGNAHNAIRIADVATRRVRTLTHDASILYGSDDFQPAVAPSGKRLVFSAEPGLGGTELRFVGRDGRGERRLTYHCVRADDAAGRHIFGTWLPDLVNARNGFRDTVACGGGYDVVHVDRRDRVDRECELVQRYPRRR